MGHTDDGRDDTAARIAFPWVGPCLALVHVSLVLIAVDSTQHFGPPGAYALVGVGLGAATAQGSVAPLTRHVNRLTVGRRVPVHGLLTAMLGLAVTHAAATLAQTRTPAASAALALVLFGAGAVLVSPGWFRLTALAGLAAWVGAMVVATHASSAAARGASWTSDALVIVVAVAGSFGLHALRRRELLVLHAMRELADEVAVRDEVTGLANRRGLLLLGSQLLEVARRQGDAVHCVFVDVDGFAALSHELGDDVGTEVLIAVSEALRTVTRSTDVVARWRNDTFTIVGPGPGMAPLELERRVRERLLAEEVVDPTRWELTITAGGSMLAPWDGGDLGALLTRADQELDLRRRLRRESRPLPRRDAAL